MSLRAARTVWVALVAALLALPPALVAGAGAGAGTGAGTATGTGTKGRADSGADSGADPHRTEALRIISLVPSLTEAVCMLDACDRLVGVDRYSNWPARVRQLPHLGGLDETPLEAVVALRPHLVLAPPATRIAPRLQELGIEVMTLPTQSHADIRSALERIGRRLGRLEQAQALWERTHAEVAQAARTIPASVQGRRVYVEVSSEPHAAGPTSFMGQTLQQLGMRNAVPAELGPFPRLNPEYIVRAQPDIIMASATSWSTMATRPGWAGLAALSRTACRLNSEDWEVLVRPGPRLGEAARIMAACLARAG